ncbi:MAG: zinc ribbon domain-containing protein [Solirubrobacterales bacterium]|nr:zinc ribbon domain-containing protein [Solirubrobacterales bacterium]
MAIYEYRCEQDGTFEITRPVGSAPKTMACPVCEGEARRVFSAPMLTSIPHSLVAARDHEEKTRHEPDVVTSLPSTGARKRPAMLPLTPTLRRLPRP